MPPESSRARSLWKLGLLLLTFMPLAGGSTPPAGDRSTLAQCQSPQVVYRCPPSSNSLSVYGGASCRSAGTARSFGRRCAQSRYRSYSRAAARLPEYMVRRRSLRGPRPKSRPRRAKTAPLSEISAHHLIGHPRPLASACPRTAASGPGTPPSPRARQARCAARSVWHRARGRSA